MIIGLGAKVAIVILMVLLFPYTVGKLFIFVMESISASLQRITRFMQDWVFYLHMIPEDKKLTVWDMFAIAWKARKGRPQI